MKHSRKKTTFIDTNQKEDRERIEFQLQTSKFQSLLLDFDDQHVAHAFTLLLAQWEEKKESSHYNHLKTNRA